MNWIISPVSVSRWFFRKGVLLGSGRPGGGPEAAGEDEAAAGRLHASEQLLSEVWLPHSGSEHGRLTGDAGQQRRGRLGEAKPSEAQLAVRADHHQLDGEHSRGRELQSKRLYNTRATLKTMIVLKSGYIYFRFNIIYLSIVFKYCFLIQLSADA